MSWYTVIKTVKGRRYQYRQRSFRLHGKVKTESQYLGPVDGGVMRGGGRSTSTTANIKTVNTCPPASSVDAAASTASKAITTNTEPSEHTTYVEPTLRIQRRIRMRSDISERSLIKEEAMVVRQMQAHGLPVNDIKPVRVWEGRKVGRKNRRTGFFVFAERGGRRNEFKRQYRQALADRWLQQAEQHNPTTYACLRSHMDTQQRRARASLTRAILQSGAADKFQAYLWFAWSGKLPKELRKRVAKERLGVVGDAAEGWRQETIKLTAQIMQHGSKKVVARAEQNAKDADRHWQHETDKLRRMGLREYLTGKAKQQRRKVANAAVWRDASEASWEKAYAVAEWYDEGEF